MTTFGTAAAEPLATIDLRFRVCRLIESMQSFRVGLPSAAFLPPKSTIREKLAEYSHQLWGVNTAERNRRPKSMQQ